MIVSGKRMEEVPKDLRKVAGRHSKTLVPLDDPQVSVINGEHTVMKEASTRDDSPLFGVKPEKNRMVADLDDLEGAPFDENAEYDVRADRKNNRVYYESDGDIVWVEARESEDWKEPKILPFTSKATARISSKTLKEHLLKDRIMIAHADNRRTKLLSMDLESFENGRYPATDSVFYRGEGYLDSEPITSEWFSDTVMTALPAGRPRKLDIGWGDKQPLEVLYSSDDVNTRVVVAPRVPFFDEPEKREQYEAAVASASVRAKARRKRSRLGRLASGKTQEGKK